MVLQLFSIPKRKVKPHTKKYALCPGHTCFPPFVATATGSVPFEDPFFGCGWGMGYLRYLCLKMTSSILSSAKIEGIIRSLEDGSITEEPAGRAWSFGDDGIQPLLGATWINGIGVS